MDTNQKFKVVFEDGTQIEKTRWDLAMFSIQMGGMVEHLDGTMTFKGSKGESDFVAYPLGSEQ